MNSDILLGVLPAEKEHESKKAREKKDDLLFGILENFNTFLKLLFHGHNNSGK